MEVLAVPLVVIREFALGLRNSVDVTDTIGAVRRIRTQPALILERESRIVIRVKSERGIILLAAQARIVLIRT